MVRHQVSQMEMAEHQYLSVPGSFQQLRKKSNTSQNKSVSPMQNSRHLEVKQYVSCQQNQIKFRAQIILNAVILTNLAADFYPIHQNRKRLVI